MVKLMWTMEYIVIITNMTRVYLEVYALVFQVELGFLMVGHTHEDIDQFFSRFSQYLRQNSVHTFPGK